MEPHRKRFRAENGSSWSNPRPHPPPRLGVGVGVVPNGSVCKRFNTPEGCPFGATCRFRHLAAAADGQDNSSQILSSGGKPKPCMKFFSTYGCPFGESCHFDHYVPGGLSSLGLSPIVSLSAVPSVAPQRKKVASAGDPSVTVNGYKTKLCNRFNSAEGCRFGEKCHFAHGESDLRLADNHSQGNFQRALPEGSGVDFPGYTNEGTGCGNAEAVENKSSFTSQGSGEAVSTRVVAGDSCANYDTGSTGQNAQMC